MFTMAGVTKQNGAFKVRFLNDATQVARIKILVKEGHTDINYVRLPAPADKAGCVTFLLTLPEFTSNPEISAVLAEADAKYNGVKTPKAPKAPKAEKAPKAPKAPKTAKAPKNAKADPATTMSKLKEKAASVASN
jgi:hypothetical protein